MAIQIEAETAKNEDDNGNVKLVPDIDEHFHVLAELNPDPRQEVTPDQRANKGEGAEHGEVSSQHSGGERNEGSYNRQHSAYQEDPVAILVDPAIGQFHIFFAKQQILAILFKKWSTAVHT